MTANDRRVVQTNERWADLSFNQGGRLLKVVEIVVPTLSKSDDQRCGVRTTPGATGTLDVVRRPGRNVAQQNRLNLAHIDTKLESR